MKYFIFMLLVVILFFGCELPSRNNFTIEIIGTNMVILTIDDLNNNLNPQKLYVFPPSETKISTTHTNYGFYVNSSDIVTLNVYLDDSLIYTETNMNPSYN